MSNLNWLVKRGYKEDHVDSEIKRVKLIKKTVSFQKRDKKDDDSITLVLTYHPALNQLYEILRRAQKYFLKSLRLVRSKLKAYICGTNVYWHKYLWSF